MAKSISERRDVVICTGEDNNCASSTVGMNVALWSRWLTAAEREEDRRLVERLKVAATNPAGAPRQGEETYGEACEAHAAWIDALPRTRHP